MKLLILAPLIFFAASVIALKPLSVKADAADVLRATAVKIGGAWTFQATVAHPDTGWDHYADAWRVVGEGGVVYGVRKLLHPHENEQPFTRSLSGVEIPEGVDVVEVQAHDSVHGWGGAAVQVELSE